MRFLLLLAAVGLVLGCSAAKSVDQSVPQPAEHTLEAITWSSSSTEVRITLTTDRAFYKAENYTEDGDLVVTFGSMKPGPHLKMAQKIAKAPITGYRVETDEANVTRVYITGKAWFEYYFDLSQVNKGLITIVVKR